MKNTLTVISMLLIGAQIAQAETLSFGGHGEKFKGGGDKIPPECQVSYPTASTAPFLVQWNCVDDNAAREEIRTELWIYRKGAQAGELVQSFLGFPANVQITPALLRTADISSGLPVSFRLVATDRAGIATVSPFMTVRTQDNSVTSCTLQIETEETASTGDTTGLPAGTVLVENARVTTGFVDDQHITVSTVQPTAATTCEVTSVCDDGEKVAFQATLALSGNSNATGVLSVTPGSVRSQLSGTATYADTSLTAVEMTGEATIDTQNATVSLDCKK